MKETGDDPETLFDHLSAKGQALVPALYRFARTRATRAATVMRLVESRPYRATGYACERFRKPISKCCDLDEPENEA